MSPVLRALMGPKPSSFTCVNRSPDTLCLEPLAAHHQANRYGQWLLMRECKDAAQQRVSGDRVPEVKEECYVPSGGT